MAQRQFRSDDTDKWLYGFGDGTAGDGSINNSTDAPIDSACSGTSGQTSLTATNVSFAAGQLILIHQTRGTGVGNWELNKIDSYTAGTITLKHALTNTYTNSGASVAQVLVMTQYNNLTINNGQTLTAKAWDGTVGGIIAKFVKGTLTVTGNITAKGGDASGTTGGTGGGFRGGNNVSGSSVTAYCGEGTAGGSVQQNGANGNGGGGGVSGPAGGTNPSGYGGGGGHVNAGATGGTIAAGTGGVGGNGSVGAAALTTAVFGGGGGGNGTSNTCYDGAGGAGGGLIFIFAKTIAEITGTVVANGGNSSTSGGCGVYGGAGAGGSILLKCQTAVLGTTKVTSLAGSNGANSSVGRIHLDYKTSTSGTTNPSLDATQDATLDWVPTGGARIINFI